MSRKIFGAPVADNENLRVRYSENNTLGETSTNIEAAHSCAFFLFLLGRKRGSLNANQDQKNPG
jgi:hypothetical protein